MSKFKVKIEKIDLHMFLCEHMKVDPYWDDLYNPKDWKDKKLNTNKRIIHGS